MVSLVLYGIIAIALAAAAGYAFLALTSSSKTISYTQENALRMDATVSGIRASLLALSPGQNGGVLFAPMGVSISDNQGFTYTTIPTSLGAVNTTPWGQLYAYCPVSPTNSSGLASGGGNTLDTTPTVAMADSVTGGAQDTYPVTTYQGPATSNVPYVVGSTQPNNISLTAAPGFLAFVLSSLGPGRPVPTCSSIVMHNGSPTVPNGIVRAVTAGFPYNQRAVASIDRLEMYVAAATSGGDRTGRDAADPASMDYAINLWLSLQPRQMTIYINGGDRVAIGSSMNLEDVRPTAALGENSSLVITTSPPSPGTVLVLSPPSPTGNEFNSAVTLENLTVNLTNSLTVTKPLTLKNVSLAAGTSMPITIVGTSLLAENINASNVPFTAINSNLEFYNLTERFAVTASGFTASPITATSSHVSFDTAAGAVGTAFNFSGTSTPGLSARASTISVDPNTVVTFTNTATHPVFLTNSSLDVTGTLNVKGGSGYDGIDALDRSSISNSGTINATGSGGTTYGVYLNGSGMGMEGTLSGSSLSGMIAMQQGELTSLGAGAGNISLGGSTSTPCIVLYQSVAGLPPDFITPGNPTGNPFSPAETPNTQILPLYTSGAIKPTPDQVTFQQAQYGFPPMVGFQNSIPVNPLNPITAANLTTARDNDPTVTLALPPTAGAFPVDPIALEKAVRNIVNAEFITGASLNFGGKCQ